MHRVATAAAFALLNAFGAEASEARVAANPIRKVVTMLQKMQTEVTEEGKKEEELFKKYMCYCKTSGGDLAKSIDAAEAKLENMGAEHEEALQRKAQLEAELKEHTAGRDDAKDTMAKSTEIREKEAAAFAKEKSDSETNIAAIKKAVEALEKGAAGSFLQSSSAKLVRTWAMEKANLPDESRQELLSFLSGGNADGYAPASGEITGILKQMGDEMAQGLADATEQEEAAIKVYEELMAAKKKEVALLQAQIEDKMTRVGELGTQLAEFVNDVEDTKEALEADKKFKAELEQGCATKEQEWEVVKATRAEELVALAETIKVLNDDDALELFKKTLPSASASFLQLQVTSAAQRAQALALIRQAAKKSPHNSGLDLLELALNGKKGGFEKVIAMVDEMVENLKVEQKADDDKKEYCAAHFDEAEDQKKELDLALKDSQTAIDEMEGTLVKLAEEIAALQEGIKALDIAVAEATEQRKQENAEYKELMSSDGLAKEVLGWAKNRLNKFYNPKLYKAPPKKELSEEERVSVSMGGTLAPEVVGGIAGTGIGAAFVQVKAHSHAVAAREAPPPPPETFGPYQTKSDSGNGVIAMIDLLVKDLDKEMQEADVSEKHAQVTYEKMLQDASDKRMADAKSLTEKESAKASTEEALEAEKEKKVDTTKQLMTTLEVIQALHSECDWLTQNYDARKQARNGEVDSLVQAKAVLSGADFALVQTARSVRATHFLGRRAL